MTLVPVAEVQAAIVSGVEPLDAETVSIFEAAGGSSRKTSERS